MILTGSVLWWRFGSGGVRQRSNPRLLKLKAFGLGMCRVSNVLSSPEIPEEPFFFIGRSAALDYWAVFRELEFLRGVTWAEGW